MSIRFVLGCPLVACVILSGCGQDSGPAPAATPPPAAEKNTSIKSLPVEPQPAVTPKAGP